MKRASYISTYLLYNRIDDVGIRAVTGALIHGLYIDQPIPREKYADVVREEDVPLNAPPGDPVVKLSREEHVESFFRDGTLRLGNFSYYNAFDHEEIGDTAEGSFILVGKRPSEVAIVEIGGGFNYYVFCCYAGEVSDACRRRFGYDSGFRIIDVEGFAAAVGENIGAQDYWFSRCVYSRHKVLIAESEDDFDFNTVSARLLDLASEAKYFVKPDAYSHQSEFRFVWRMPSDVDVPIDIRCPVAVKYCRR